MAIVKKAAPIRDRKSMAPKVAKPPMTGAAQPAAGVKSTLGGSSLPDGAADFTDAHKGQGFKPAGGMGAAPAMPFGSKGKS